MEKAKCFKWVIVMFCMVKRKLQKSKKRVVRKFIRKEQVVQKECSCNEGNIFLGGIFLIIAVYIIMYIDDPVAKVFGGGVMTLLGLMNMMKQE